MESGADGIRTHDLLRARQGTGASQRRRAPVYAGFRALSADQRQPSPVGAVTACVTASSNQILLILLQQRLEARVVVGVGEDFATSPATHCWPSSVVLWALL